MFIVWLFVWAIVCAFALEICCCLWKMDNDEDLVVLNSEYTKLVKRKEYGEANLVRQKIYRLIKPLTNP